MEIKGYENQLLKDPKTTVEIFRAILKTENKIDRDKEHFWTVGLNQANKIKYIELVSLGTLNASLIHPREVFRMAIFEAIGAIILIHNHPSMSITPSEDDLKTVQRLVEAGKIIGINVLDSIIVTEDDFFSWREKGLL